MKKVFVNGYGSIGSRITSFLKDDPEISVIGVGKYSPDDDVNVAISRGLDVYVPEQKLNDFKNFKISGTIESALDDCDLVIDAAPGGHGYKNKKNFYEPKNLMAIYQGGETILGDEAVSDLLFNSRANYNLAIGKKHVLDTIEMTEAPHHGDDVKTYFGKDAPLFVRAIKVPTRQMHLHIMDIRFNDKAPKPSEIHDIFTNEFGVATLWTAKGTKDIRDYAKNMGFNFTDTNMIHIHANMTVSIGDTVQMMYSDDQTGIVIPENHLLLQAMLFGKSYNDAFSHTESIFHMKEKKQKLQQHFARKN